MASRIPYADRPEWSDVVPVPQKDENPVVRIAYSDEFRDIMDYFRGVLNTGEYSKRCWDLCNDVCEINPANYTAWVYRRDLLRKLKFGVDDLLKELDVLAEVIDENPKNYQVWCHREWVVKEVLGRPDNCGSNFPESNISAGDADQAQLLQSERMFLRGAFNEEPKNYHAWSYRISLIKFWINEITGDAEHLAILQAEREFTDEMLQLDSYNNSAWNHRHNIVNMMLESMRKQPGSSEDDCTSLLAAELDITMHRLRSTMDNASVYPYLRSLVESHLPEKKEEVLETLRTLAQPSPAESGDDGKPALLNEAGIPVGWVQAKTAVAEWTDREEERQQLCRELVDEDRIRRKYWAHIAGDDELLQKLLEED